MALHLLKHLPFGVFVLDQAGTIQWANPACRAMVSGTPSGQLEGLVLPAEVGQSAEYTTSDTTDGRPRSLQCRRLPDLAGAAAFVLEDASLRHAAQQTIERLEAEVGKADRHETLTGLPNRRALIDLLETQIARSRRYHNPLAVIRLELQDLEARPERRAAVLIAVAQLLNDQLRWSDIRGYWNEATFLLVLPETSASSATRLAGKLITRLASTVRDDRGEALAIYACAAVTAWTRGDDLQRMMTRVNTLMEQAGNKVPPIATG